MPFRLSKLREAPIGAQIVRRGLVHLIVAGIVKEKFVRYALYYGTRGGEYAEADDKQIRWDWVNDTYEPNPECESLMMRTCGTRPVRVDGSYLHVIRVN